MNEVTLNCYCPNCGGDFQVKVDYAGDLYLNRPETQKCQYCGAEANVMGHVCGVGLRVEVHLEGTDTKASQAHINDIRARYVRPDGSVGREKDRFYTATMEDTISGKARGRNDGKHLR